MSRMYSLSFLESLETLSVGQADDLKINGNGFRVWLSRCSVEDGEPFDNKVTIEKKIGGRWVEAESYPAF